MKKQTIWILTVLMGITFMGLLFLQIFYVRNMVKMRYDQFEQAVKQSLHAVAGRLDYDETRRFLEEEVDSIQSTSIYTRYLNDTGVHYSFTTNTGIKADMPI